MKGSAPADKLREATWSSAWQGSITSASSRWIFTAGFSVFTRAGWRSPRARAPNRAQKHIREFPEAVVLLVRTSEKGESSLAFGLSHG